MKLAAFTLAAVTAGFLLAQEAPVASIKLGQKVKAGATLKGTLTMTFGEGWHGYQNPPLDRYQNPVTLTLDQKGWKIQKIAYPKGIIKEMAGTEAAVYEGEIKVPFEIVAPKKVGKSVLEFVLSYQQCNDSTCLPPTSMKIKVPIEVQK